MLINVIIRVARVKLVRDEDDFCLFMIFFISVGINFSLFF